MLIAEIGINHNGSINKALKLISEAHASGADVVKFQKRNPDKCVPQKVKQTLKKTPWGEMTYIDYKYRMEFGKKEYDLIDLHCKELGIKWTASVWDIDSLNFMTQYNVPFIKIPSALITDHDLLEACLIIGIPIMISTGMSTMLQITDAISILDKDDSQKLMVLHCNSSYPSIDSELDLNMINSYQTKWPDFQIGYSGHEVDYLPSVIAWAMGAEIIERHFTLDKDMWGSDHKASLTPVEFRKMKDLIERVDLIKGKNEKCIYPKEVEMLKKLRPE